MANLTKEYFDKELRATKTDLKGEIGKLSTHIDNEIADLAGMVKRRFDEVERKLDVREKVEQLEIQMKKVWEALSL